MVYVSNVERAEADGEEYVESLPLPVWDFGRRDGQAVANEGGDDEGGTPGDCADDDHELVIRTAADLFDDDDGGEVDEGDDDDADVESLPMPRWPTSIWQTMKRKGGQ